MSKSLYRITTLSLNEEDQNSCERIKAQTNISYVDIFRAGLRTVEKLLNERQENETNT